MFHNSGSFNLFDPIQDPFWTAQRWVREGKNRSLPTIHHRYHKMIKPGTFTS